MLTFNDVPPNSPQGSGVGAPTQGAASNAIQTAWDPWFQLNTPLAPVVLPIGLVDIAAAMAADTMGSMPVAACLTYCGLYLIPEPATGVLCAQTFMARLPSHHRRTADEILGIALSLAVALNQGYQFFGSRLRVNALFGGPLWMKPWQGDGPDYLLANTIEFAFMEVKSRGKKCVKRPYKFCEHKTQSVNAQLNPVLFGINPPVRYLLSYANLPASSKVPSLRAATVQWFNATTPEATNRGTGIGPTILIAVALSQFMSQIENAGHDPERLLGRGTRLPKGFDEHTNYAVERSSSADAAIGFSLRALRLFRYINQYFRQLRAGRTSSALRTRRSNQGRYLSRALLKLKETVPVSVNWRDRQHAPRYIYATGIFIVTWGG